MKSFFPAHFGHCRQGGKSIYRAVAVASLLLALTSCASAPSAPVENIRPRSPDAFQTESGLGGYLAGRYAARAEKNTTAAADFFIQALIDDPDNEILIHRTMQLMLADGRLRSGRMLAERVLQFAPHDGLANLVLALNALKAEDYSTAQKRAQEMSKSGFNLLIAPIIFAWAKQGQGQVDMALQALDALKQNQAFEGFRHFDMALIQDLAGRTKEAGESYRLANMDTSGLSLRIVEAYGGFLARTGKTAEAHKVYSDYLMRNPENPAIAALLQELSAGRGPQRPVATTPAEGVAEALYGAAIALARNDRSDSGEIYVRLALYLRPNFALARTLLGDLHEADGRWAEAIEDYREIEPTSPYSWPTRLRAAWALARIDRKAEAITAFKAMTAEQPKKSDALVALGDLYRGEEKFPEAVEQYTQALARLEKVDQRAWSIYYARGISYERSKQWDKAEADLLKALDFRPEEPLLLNYLGYSWVDQGKNLDRGLSMIEQAVRQRPNDGYIVDSLGWAFYRLGRYEDAVDQLERAVELRPEDPTINDHLGDAYWRIKRQTEAKVQWRRALSLKPEAAQVPLIEEKLTRIVTVQPPSLVRPVAQQRRNKGSGS